MATLHRRRATWGATCALLGGLSVPPLAAATVDGEALYLEYCAVCHGAEGRGDGPAAAALQKPPSDLTGLAAANGGAFPATMVYQLIDGRRLVLAHGDADMPIWGRRFARTGVTEAEVERRVGALLNHLESLQRTDRSDAE